MEYNDKEKYFTRIFSGGLPSSLRFGTTGLASPTAPATGAANNTSSSAPTVQAPSSTTGTGSTSSSNDPSNYAGVFAQMLNMMSNQNIVCFYLNIIM